MKIRIIGNILSLADGVHGGSPIKPVALVSFNRVISLVVVDVSYAPASILRGELHALD
jgi:hypothetical protein